MYLCSTIEVSNRYFIKILLNPGTCSMLSSCGFVVWHEGQQLGLAVSMFQPKHPFSHPEKCLCLSSKNYCFDQSIPKTISLHLKTEALKPCMDDSGFPLPKYWKGNPEILGLSLSKNTFSQSEYPKNVLFDFGNRRAGEENIGQVTP